MSESIGIKGMSVMPVLLGRIGIGAIVQNGEANTLQCLDHIRVTELKRTNGQWDPHPIMEKLVFNERQAHPDGYASDAEVKLRRIPVRIMFDSPENTFRSEFVCFDQNRCPACIGNGETARRSADDGQHVDVECHGHSCEFGVKHGCKQFGRLVVGIEGLFEKDPLAGFIFRTTGINSIRTLTARITYLAAMTGNKLCGLPCDLVLRTKSRATDEGEPVHFMDIVPTESLLDSVQKAKEWRAKLADAGLDCESLDRAVADGFTSSDLFGYIEDSDEVRDEFYPAPHGKARQESEAPVLFDQRVLDFRARKEALKPHEKQEELAQQGKTEECCTPTQIRNIEALLDQFTDRDGAKAELFNYLKLPHSTVTSLMSMSQAASAVQHLMMKLKQQSIAGNVVSVPLCNYGVTALAVVKPDASLIPPIRQAVNSSGLF